MLFVIFIKSTEFVGDIKDLRRQKKLSDLVREGQNEAEVTVKVHKGQLDDQGKSIKDTVTCTIFKNRGDAVFKKNNRRVNKGEIHEMAKEYQIQTSNMCQFLPQEKVAEFAKMKPLDRFQSTLKAIGNLEMLKKHEGLATKQKTMADKEESKNLKVGTLQSIEGGKFLSTFSLFSIID